MEYLVLILSSALGLVGIYIGVWTFKKYTHIVHSLEPVSIRYVVRLAAWMGVSGCFCFFALIVVLGFIVERKSDFSLQGIFGLMGISVGLGVIGFFGSLYQIYTTVKYRDLLLDKKIIKKKD